MIYFTSDLHFGHKNVIQWRPQFATIEEMDEALIANWNETVHKDDTVIILGDLFFRNQRPAEEYLERLKGKKILIRGNHDAYWLRHWDSEKINRYFEGVHDLYGIKRDRNKLRFCHFPMVSWESSRRGSILVCGHIHGQSSGYEFEMFKKIPAALNAGVDINGFRPVRFSELVENNDLFYRRVRSEEERRLLTEAAESFG